MNYKDTINLPYTDFKMKAKLAEQEPRMQRRWDEMDLYEMLREERSGDEKFILHDGPPYPTGDLHIGTGLNKVLKDFFVRYYSMRGYDAPYVPGWDCHGLPIEVKVLEDLEESRDATPRTEIRRRCRQYAERYLEVQKRQFRSLGVMGEWDNPYLTLAPEYEAGVLEVFAEMVAGGYVYRDLKPVHWCYHCQTVLAEAELEYEDIPSHSIYVNFPVLRHADEAAAVDPWKLFDLHDDDDVSVLIWTTTPWTLPANLAVAVHPAAEYAAVRYKHLDKNNAITSIMAASLVDIVLPKCGIEDYEVVGTVKGHKLVGMQYRHAFLDRKSPVVPAPYVTLDEGTGCVHTAPGHGMEDYATGLEHGLNILSPIDGKGYFSDEAGPFAGQHIEEGNKNIVQHLREGGALIHDEEISHSYPHCWRCHKPVIFRATNQWFVRMDHEGFRKKVIEAVDGVNWVPEWGHQRMRHMVSERPDWCLSRQKSWGLPIPAFYCEECGEVLITRQTVLRVAEAFREKGSDSWFEEEGVEPFIGSDVKCKKCGSSSWRKESDIFDVWFESGSSHNSVCRHRESLQFPADIYLEGTDQYRGWFQLSLLPSMAAWNAPPYRTVLTHGFVVDDQGKKMSKSAGNFIGVEEAVEEFHAEILRLWMLSVDYRDTISVSRDYIRKNMVDAYRRIRNTFRFMLGNLADFNPLEDGLSCGELKDIDRWILDEVSRLVEQVTEAWDRYSLHRVYTLLHNFCAVQMSSVYLNALKDRLYCSAVDWTERRSAQTALRHVLLVLCRLCAPVLVHSAEEVWEHIEDKDEDLESIHLAHWPDPPKEWKDDELRGRWVRFLHIRDDVDRAIESLRESEDVSNSMDACVRLWTNDVELRNLLNEHYDTLLELLMVSELELPEEEPEAMADAEVQEEGEKSGLKVFARPSAYKKCERCWNLRPSVGDDAEFPGLCERCIKAVGEQESQNS